MEPRWTGWTAAIELDRDRLQRMRNYQENRLRVLHLAARSKAEYQVEANLQRLRHSTPRFSRCYYIVKVVAISSVIFFILRFPILRFRFKFGASKSWRLERFREVSGRLNLHCPDFVNVLA